jgi:hypothetical protein
MIYNPSLPRIRPAVPAISQKGTVSRQSPQFADDPSSPKSWSSAESKSPSGFAVFLPSRAPKSGNQDAEADGKMAALALVAEAEWRQQDICDGASPSQSTSFDEEASVQKHPQSLPGLNMLIECTEIKNCKECQQ